jgi:glutathione S-transferase kappa 1
MLYIKAHYPTAKFEAAFYSLFPALWVPPQSDLSKTANLHVSPALHLLFDGLYNNLIWRLQALLLQNFTSAQADEIIAGAGTPEIKQQLTSITKMVVEKQGAFGCPWYWATNSEGKSEPFFGSDRHVLSLAVNYGTYDPND